MKRIVAVAASAALWVCAGAATAASAPPSTPASPAVQTADDLQAWLGRISVWNSGYAGLIQGRTDQMLALVEGGEQVLQFAQRGDRAGARRWADDWAARTRAEFAALNDRYPALEPHPPTPPRVPGNEERARMMMAQQVEFRDRTGSLLRQSTEIADRFIERVIAASSGREEDLLALSKGFFELGIAQLEAENLMMIHARPAETEVGYHYFLAMTEVNEAALDWMVFVRDRTLGLEVDAAASAEGIRGHARAAEAAARTLKANVQVVRSQIASDPSLAGQELRETLLFVMDSMLRSADVELRIAAQLMRVADAVATGDVEASLAAYDPIEGLIEQRVAGDAERRARLAAN